MEDKNHISPTDLSRYLKEVFGEGYDTLSITNMHGGAQKVVYQVECANGFKCMLYVWDESMNYFQEEKLNEEMMDVSSGADLFEFNNKFLLEHGIRTPKLYWINKEKKEYPYDFAFVECISGGKIEQYFNLDDEVKDKALSNFGKMLKKMHSIRRPIFGKLGHDDSLGTDRCESVILKNTMEDLLHISSHVHRVEENRDRLTKVLKDLYNNIKPRADYGVIHGELGPDHVLVGDNLEPYLIDIEGAMFFDVEFEHSFLQFRFGDCYKYLENDELDKDRLLFYKLHHHIACSSAGFKLMDRGFPDQDLAREIFDSNTNATLKFLEL